ncbi:selenium-dependent molybdenum cofactor biosynthesis protein YqeB [Eubacteriaceae bacterium ES3]|nr:selenium-dependent molybdenum cofactor biosynthesis protein YqeB [Eubacteriaceae bacterium ES3]
MKLKDVLIVVRGGGDIATGTIHRLHSSGFKVVVLEVEEPSAIRRQVSFSEAVYDGQATIEGVKAIHVDTASEIERTLSERNIPVLIDPQGLWISRLKPQVVVDAILAKKNLGTDYEMAPLTIALGPGFTAGVDVDVVIETMRGHNLGRIIRKGTAIANTGIPGSIAGHTSDRVIHASHQGLIRNVKSIGDAVTKGQEIAIIENSDGAHPVEASISGIIRGLIRDGYNVTQGFKIADIDPRTEELKNCFTISDKARCIAGSVLEAVLYGVCN